MSLQNWIDWWREYSAKKQEVISCGIWPTAFPPKFDIFIECCIDHDLGYRESELLYARGVVERNDKYKTDALDLKKDADITFYACVRARYQKTSWPFILISRWWGEKYIELVLANGDRIWFGSIGVIIADAESGDHPIIKEAIIRGMQKGTLEETQVVKQAYTLSREAKTRH